LIKDFEFRDFVLNEQRIYLGQKVGDILTAVHDLHQDGKSMSSRDLIKFSERIVNQIRRILHSQWPREEQSHLKTLQKAAVALMKAIDERNDVHGAVASVAQELEKLTSKLGVPLHRLASPEKSEPSQKPAGTSKPEQQMTKQPQNPIMPMSDPNTPMDASPPLGGSQQPGTMANF
jgi:hypothetical protein